jgi:hypothetical protein
MRNRVFFNSKRDVRKISFLRNQRTDNKTYSQARKRRTDKDESRDFQKRNADSKPKKALHHQSPRCPRLRDACLYKKNHSD